MKSLIVLTTLCLSTLAWSCVDYNPATGNYTVDSFGAPIYEPGQLQKAPSDLNRPRVWAEDDHQLHVPQMMDRMFR